MLKLGNLSLRPWTLYQNSRRRKRKSKDSGELEANKAYKKNKNSARAQFDKNREAKSIWCCSPKFSDVLKAKAAVFPSLPRQEQLVCLTAASFAIKAYDSDLVYSRKKKKELSDRKGWGSYLTNEELAIIGELDGKEATDIFNGSQKNSYEYSTFGSSVSSYSIEGREHGLYSMHCGDRMVSTWIGEPFVDRDDIDYEDEDEDNSEEILEDKASTKLLEGHQSYWMKMEEAMFRNQVLSI